MYSTVYKTQLIIPQAHKILIGQKQNHEKIYSFGHSNYTYITVPTV